MTRDSVYAEEAAVIDVLEVVCEAMERAGVSRSELARRLGCSRANVTNMLRGDGNLCVRTLGRIADAIDRPLIFSIKPEPRT